MTGFDEKRYEQLLVAFHPRPISTESEFEAAEESLDKLLARPELSREEQLIVDLMTTLVEEWENKTVHIPAADPIDVIRFLLDQAGKRQKDLVPIFGTESIVSEVLAGRRDLQSKHIAGLAAFFHVSPAAFFGELDQPAPANQLVANQG